MFKNGDIVLCTGNFEDNDTGGKIGKVVDIWRDSYKIGFFDKLKRSNDDGWRYVGKYPDVKSIWWVRSYLIKSPVSKNKFK